MATRSGYRMRGEPGVAADSGRSDRSDCSPPESPLGFSRRNRSRPGPIPARTAPMAKPVHCGHPAARPGDSLATTGITGRRPCAPRTKGSGRP